MKITGIPHVVIDRGARIVACDVCRSVQEVGGNLFGFVNVASKFARIHAGCGQKRPVNVELEIATEDESGAPITQTGEVDGRSLRKSLALEHCDRIAAAMRAKWEARRLAVEAVQ